MIHKRSIDKHFLLITLLLGVFACTQSPDQPNKVQTGRYKVTDFLSVGDTARFKRATQPKTIRFPEDLGTHPSFKTEWWYYTGNLSTKTGRSFGYELTIFRSGLQPAPVQEHLEDSTGWRTRNIYMAHLALADVANNEFYSFERYSRGAADLAGAQVHPFAVWLEDWRVEADTSRPNRFEGIPDMKLEAGEGPVSLALTLSSRKPPVLQGNRGLDKKGPEPGNASYYFSLTRLQTKGIVNIKGREFKVTGTSWMDREWSTSALSKDQEGWDWFALQLTNNKEIMYYRIRGKDGTVSPFSNGVIVDQKGNKTEIASQEIKLTPLAYWESPASGARYPIKWRMEIPGRKIDLKIIPKMQNQELQTRFQYWEGAVRVTGRFNGSSVKGHGYVELTGYAGKPM